MATEERLYTFSEPTKEALKKFRLSTSRSEDPQAVIYSIDKKTLEVTQTTQTIYSNLEDLAEDIPPNTPRYILLSYPLTLSDGRRSVPYVMLAFTPPTCNQELRMIYAGAQELFRRESQAGKCIEIDDGDDVGDREKVEGWLKG